ncbi:MAG TPA: VWA domain-containing protein [Planctomycetes bacterium]|nr:VWA domain-containing protein [Planctomycetota bacterium]
MKLGLQEVWLKEPGDEDQRRRDQSESEDVAHESEGCEHSMEQGERGPQQGFPSETQGAPFAPHDLGNLQPSVGGGGEGVAERQEQPHREEEESDQNAQVNEIPIETSGQGVQVDPVAGHPPKEGPKSGERHEIQQQDSLQSARKRPATPTVLSGHECPPAVPAGHDAAEPMRRFYRPSGRCDILSYPHRTPAIVRDGVFMKKLCLFATLALAVAPAFAASPQDERGFSKARQYLVKMVKKGTWAKRKAAIDALVETGHPKTMDALMTAVHVVDKNLQKVQAGLKPLRKQRKKIAAKIDKRFGGKSSVSLGSVENLMKAMDEISAKMAPKEKAWRLELRTRNALLDAVGDAVGRMPTEARLEQTQRLLKLFERAKKPHDQELYLDMLGHLRTAEASAALLGIVTTSTRPEHRVLALEALADIGDPQASRAAMLALDDEYWQVRAAAAQALRKLGDIDAIPRLIRQLGEEPGRLKGDMLEALKALTGINRHDNAAVWAGWWKENEAAYRTMLERLSSDNPAERGEGLEAMAKTGFLLAVRKTLERRGIGVPVQGQGLPRKDPEDSAPVEPGGKNAGGVDAAVQETDALEDAIGRAIASRDKDIRKRALEKLILEPLEDLKAPPSRRLLIHVMGRVGGERAEKLLTTWAKRKSTIDPWKKGDRRAAIEALGFVRTPTAASTLVSLFEYDDEPALLEAAVRALAERKDRVGVRSLIRALGEIQSRKEAPGSAEITQTILSRLEDLVGESKGSDFQAWAAWWKSNASSFKGENDADTPEEEAAKKASQENPSGTTFYGIKTWSKRLAFVLDVSGSMNEPADYAGGSKRKIDVAKEQLTQAITSLPKGAWFNIIFYSSDYKLWKKRLVQATPAIKAEAKAWVAQVEANGATNIYDPLVKAFELAGRGSKDKDYQVALDTIFFLSDGQPNRGRVTSPQDIVREIRRLNRLKRVQIHTIGVGRGHNAGFMKALADLSGGTYIAR